MAIPELAAAWRDARRICIVMLSAIGDAVHVLPVVNALKRDRPDVKIDWVIQPVPHQLVRFQPGVDDFILFHRARGLALAGELRRTVRALRRRSYDLVLGLQVYLKAGLILRAARSPIRLGFDRARARDLQWVLTTHRIPVAPPAHVQDQYFEFVRTLGVDPDPVVWNLQIQDEEQAAQRAFYRDLPGPVCALVVGTSKPQKNWAPDRYARLIEVLVREYGLTPMLVGGPSDVERRAARDIERMCTVPVRRELGDDLRRLVYLIQGSDLVISPDTGPLHIARALDVPVVGLYGYTNPKRTGPYRKYVDLVVDGYARTPGEDYPITMQNRPGAMERITVDMVAEKIARARTRYARTGSGGRA